MENTAASDMALVERLTHTYEQMGNSQSSSQSTADRAVSDGGGIGWELLEQGSDTDRQVMARAESVMRRIGLLGDTRTNPETSDQQAIDVVREETVARQKEAQILKQSVMSLWKPLLTRLPYHIALEILEFNWHLFS